MAGRRVRVVQPAREVFGARIRLLRREQGLSQEALAHAAGLDRSYVGQVERGERNVSFDNILKLARGLDLRTARLFDTEPPL